ncbi:MAG: cyclic nucleotide-binding domain-containing protein [Thermoleophilaceae bacterium]
METQRFEQFDVFAHLPAEQLEKLGATVNEWSAQAGETLIKSNASSFQLFAIESGTVEVCDHGDPVATLGAGEVVGEIGVLKRGLRKATVEVAEDAQGFFLTNSQVEMLRRDAPDFEQRLEQLSEQRGH